ncbi:MAG: bifunctional demethylmenaquinone methyltransferase/2-methoxy-6-polyprenyl-1,4-benzoquinol methylase UbiE [Haliscomenobacter sp.]|nr:bifunctional demethylmenaquinone methyltransferase/2-methoxy-6-polyprenyl-1,4-benzoquinol methylase UbiE [Haliscomenobacter sp.]
MERQEVPNFSSIHIHLLEDRDEGYVYICKNIFHGKRNQALPGGRKQKTQVSRMFDKIAPYYDFLNHLLSLGIDVQWIKRAIRQLDRKEGQTILDVATGTADLAMEIYRQIRPEKIVGIDISNEMLDIGRGKIKAKNWHSWIELLQGDSENLPFEDNTFDAVTVAFGVRNFENLEKGLAEMRRVLKPGAKMVVLEFSKPRLFPFRQIFNAYFKYLLPLIGRLTSKDQRAYQYLFESVQVFPDGEAFLDVLSKQGFKSSRCIPLTLGVCSIYVSSK